MYNPTNAIAKTTTIPKPTPREMARIWLTAKSEKRLMNICIYKLITKLIWNCNKY